MEQVIEPLTMLIVDDIEMNRIILRKMFEDEYVILETENGIHAMDLLKNQDIDIVILDIVMPKKDGFQLMEEMKADRELSEIPIVIKTSVNEEFEIRAFELGADDFIFSPFDATIVKKRISNITQKYILERKYLKGQMEYAQNMEQVKSNFWARMSHEIRTPIHSIMGISELAIEKLEDKTSVKEALKKVNEQSRYLLTLVNDILDISAIEQGKITIHKAPFHLKQLVTTIAEIYYTQCLEKGITFDLYIQNVVSEWLIGDSMRLRQVFVNLIFNAYKFTEEGGSIKVSVTAKGISKNTLCLLFTVEDTGCGINEETREKIWKPFEQGYSQLEQKCQGSGLGLSITKSLVELMGGTISFATQENKGTTFITEIPFEIAEQRMDSQAEQFRNIRALIVDDDLEACKYTADVLERIGVSYEVVHSGEDALNMLADAYHLGKGFDICFIDWKMPGLSGIEVTKRIRSMFDHDTVIIIVSAYDLSHIQEEATNAGANLLIAKPIFQSTVYDLLMNLSEGVYNKQEGGTSQYYFQGKRVLIAEDNAINAEILRAYLANVGVESVCTQNGQSTIDCFLNAKADEFDAILMDIHMPVVDGYEATKMIRHSNHNNAQRIPIIAVTANAFTEDVVAAFEVGMNAHVTKPIEPKVLYKALDDVWK
ncbi:response regulator [Lachnospiraceae bacterium LCP25S3_G4]